MAGDGVTTVSPAVQFPNSDDPKPPTAVPTSGDSSLEVGMGDLPMGAFPCDHRYPLVMTNIAKMAIYSEFSH